MNQLTLADPPPVAPRHWLPALLGLAAVSGTSFLFIKVAVREVHPMYVALGRVGLAALVLLVVLAVRGEPLPRGSLSWWHLSSAAAFGVAAPFTLISYGEQWIASALAGVWTATTPLFALPVAALVFRTERMTVRRTVGLVLGVLGVAVTLGSWHPTGTGQIAGHLLCLAAAGCYGVAIPYQKRFLVEGARRAVAVAAAQLLAATAQLAVLAPLVAGPPPALTRLPITAVGSVLTLAVVGTALGLLLSLRNIRLLGATGAATVTYLVPVVAVIAGVAFLGERLAWHHLLGAIVVLAAIAIGVTPPEPANFTRTGHSTPTPARSIRTPQGRAEATPAVQSGSPGTSFR
jgi:drug/metabolite transporter (DMT)-like permease